MNDFHDSTKAAFAAHDRLSQRIAKRERRAKDRRYWFGADGLRVGQCLTTKT
jgi:hypothetical protein